MHHKFIKQKKSFKPKKMKKKPKSPLNTAKVKNKVNMKIDNGVREEKKTGGEGRRTFLTSRYSTMLKQKMVSSPIRKCILISSWVTGPLE